MRKAIASALFLLLLQTNSYANDQAQIGKLSVITDQEQVVGGEPAPAGKWPDTAGVYSGNRISCTGVLIAPTIVLTAGHCVETRITSVRLNITNIRDQGEEIKVSRIVEHSNWWSTYDIAILILEKESTVKPRTIASGCMREQHIKNGANVAVVGFGSTDEWGENPSDILREGFTTITDFNCTTQSGCNQGAKPDGELGAGGNGVDSCFGDSGGPLYLLTDRGSFLVGITSRAYANVSKPCSDGGIYVRPDKLVEWIESEIGFELEDPICNRAPEPKAELLEVTAGDVGVLSIQANDPDIQDTHQYQILEVPKHGEASVATDGTVSYKARTDHIGEDQFTVRVTDNGQLFGDVNVQVIVLEAGCGCDSQNSNQGLVTLLFMLMVFVFLSRPRKKRQRHK